MLFYLYLIPGWRLQVWFQHHFNCYHHYYHIPYSVVCCIGEKKALVFSCPEMQFYTNVIQLRLETNGRDFYGEVSLDTQFYQEFTKNKFYIIKPGNLRPCNVTTPYIFVGNDVFSLW